ncbi:MAG: hypothetical protein ACKN9T_01650 [Candidatus Methylumidiphilus sp.]
MAWQYSVSNNIATLVETGEQFAVTLGGDDAGGMAVTLAPLSGAGLRTAEELRAMKDALWPQVMEALDQTSLRAELAELIKNPLIGDPFQAAEIIAKVSGNHVTHRAVRAWLAEPDKRSSRNCPAWAVAALDSYLAEPDNQKRLKDLTDYYTVSAAVTRPPQAKDTPKPAAPPVEGDKWRQASLATLPDLLSEHERHVDGWLQCHNTVLAAVADALQESYNFDEFRRNLLARLDAWRDGGAGKASDD